MHKYVLSNFCLNLKKQILFTQQSQRTKIFKTRPYCDGYGTEIEWATRVPFSGELEVNTKRKEMI